MINNHLLSDSITDAAFVRYAAKGEMAFLWDEADETFNRYSQNKEVTKALNNGWTSGGAFHKCSGDEHSPTVLPTHCAVALVGIGLDRKLPKTTLSRSLMLQMDRAPRSFRRWRKKRDLPVFEELGRKLLRYINDNAEAIANFEVTDCEEFGLRESDKVAPLLAIAEFASPERLQRLRAVLLELKGASNFDPENINVRFITDVIRIYNEGYVRSRSATDKGITPQALAEELGRLTDPDDSSVRWWSKYNPTRSGFRDDEDAARIKGNQVINLLKGFKVKKISMRYTAEEAAQYGRENFEGFKWEELLEVAESYAPSSSKVIKPPL